jgi:hypothetical protein
MAKTAFYIKYLPQHNPRLPNQTYHRLSDHRHALDVFVFHKVKQGVLVEVVSNGNSPNGWTPRTQDLQFFQMPVYAGIFLPSKMNSSGLPGQLHPNFHRQQPIQFHHRFKHHIRRQREVLSAAGNLQVLVAAAVFLNGAGLGLRHKVHPAIALKNQRPIGVVSAQRRRNFELAG